MLINNKSKKKSAVDLKAELLNCCGNEKWADEMSGFVPFGSAEEIEETAEKIWNKLGKEDKLESFGHHPKIGDIESLKKKYSSSGELSKQEQSGIHTASEITLKELAVYNEEYEKKFGYVFLVCATGKTADEMLGIIKIRILNDPETEFRIACNELIKITKLRLNRITGKLL
ncbi:MAG: 2-oxo-4-hydroxy-4-carboxy-5-ureidoimidazoline decarboxylase [Ignavibacteria bacterium]|nr:2-oxo-4-hydroxy-4-carboxy-5-ureidoimidazoline decarboxylase [Ignavibacteria bacterium]